jgi:large subunit ribosomal protein L30e
MDFNASLRRAIKTGDVILGQNNTEKCVKEGRAQMVVIAANCPENFKKQLTGYENIFIHTFEGSSVALGKACGKPFMVSTLAIVSAGESDILSLKRTA